MKQLPLLLIVFWSLWGGVLFAQVQTEDEDLHQYFEDKGMSKRKNIIATNVLAPFHGELGLRYERGITDHFSLEIGLKRLMPFYLFEAAFSGTAPLDGLALSTGYGFSIAPHFYFWGRAPEFHYFGPRFARRTHFLENESKFTFSDITIDYGYNLLFTKHLIFNYETGIGYRRVAFERAQNLYWGRGSYTEGGLVVMFMLGIGVIF